MAKDKTYVGVTGHRTFFTALATDRELLVTPVGQVREKIIASGADCLSHLGICPVKSQLTRGPSEPIWASPRKQWAWDNWVDGYLNREAEGSFSTQILTKRIHASTSSPVMASPHKHPAVPLCSHLLPSHLMTSSFLLHSNKNSSAITATGWLLISVSVPIMPQTILNTSLYLADYELHQNEPCLCSGIFLMYLSPLLGLGQLP